MEPATQHRPRDRQGEPALAILLVLALHGVFALWLSRIPPVAVTDRQRSSSPRMTLVFLPRPLQAAGPQASPPGMITRSPSSQRVVNTASAAMPRSTQTLAQVDMRRSARSSDSPVATSGNTSQSLNLSLPATVVDTATPTRNFMQRTAPVDYQATRFAGDWTPDGGEIQQTWAFRSKLAGAALSLTGALERPCNQRERDQRLRRCFGKQYQGDMDPPITRAK
ncbi:hypothetical protein XSP_000298 [Xanthomonas euroxanthea]|uniref:Uncharacterized protein n=1 Tax=Xanthomonas euroxanthea TaxID=2259622 RepID=A0A8E4DPR6_9XANT|nr:hypothetical protein [Xanthomonas euroxanthea]CAD1786548.1 hypothetical protein XSP_000298 [Xanthomonas euroxanthea]SYZ50907.1 hypothetical protein CPBF367_02990 [Xanthomonas arboricola pv. juglandis]